MAKRSKDIPKSISASADACTSQTETFLSQVRKWNASCNLVSQRDEKHLEEVHLTDSLDLQKFIGTSRTLLDVGSGGGFPGVPLAIALPDLEVTCLERAHKKCRFLRYVKMTLELENLSVVEADVRNAIALRNSFDAVTIRAVTKPRQAWELAKPMLHKCGYALLQTASHIDDSMLDHGFVADAAPATRGWISVVKRAAPRL